jgi:hypothetical protein
LSEDKCDARKLVSQKIAKGIQIQLKASSRGIQAKACVVEVVKDHLCFMMK